MDEGVAGVTEVLPTLPISEAAEYFIRVTGEADLNQFYQLDVVMLDVTGVAGDVNQDGVLDLLDLDAFLAGWRSDTTGLTQLEQTQLGDLNFSGLTDLSDAKLLQQALLSAGISSPFSLAGLGSVPEPTAGLLATPAAMLLVGREPTALHSRIGDHIDA